MTATYDFSEGKKGPVAGREPQQSQITLWLDDEIIGWFRQ
jgi:hypothetical protein